MMTDGCTLTAQHTVLAMPIGELTVVREGHRQQRQAGRLRRRPEVQAEAPGSGAGEGNPRSRADSLVMDPSARLARLCSPTGTVPSGSATLGGLNTVMASSPRGHH
jgi:hypothetical protein